MAIRAALSCRGPSALWAGGWSQTVRRGGAVLTGGYPPGKRAHSQEEAPGPAFICKAAETPLKWAGSGLEVAPAAHPEKSGEGATEGSGLWSRSRGPGSSGHRLHGDRRLPRPRGYSSGLWGRDAVSHVAPHVWSAPHVQWLPGVGPPY